MNFSHKKINGILVNYVHLKHASKEYSEEFKKLLLSNIEEGNKNIVVDISECEFIDSTFISALVTALKTINQREGKLKIVSAHTNVQSVLELTGMFKVFEIYKNIKEAVESFKSAKILS